MATTKTYKVVPAAAAGISRASSGGAAWSNSAYTQVVAASVITSDFWICGGIFVPHTPVAAADITYETEIDLAVGGAGAEVVIATFPMAMRVDTLVGPVVTAYVPLPNPKFVVANSRLAVRIRQSLATTSQTVTGIKFWYYQ